jgi:hypothetical protein
MGRPVLSPRMPTIGRCLKGGGACCALTDDRRNGRGCVVARRNRGPAGTMGRLTRIEKLEVRRLAAS